MRMHLLNFRHSLMPVQTPLAAFYSYAHEDRRYLKKIYVAQAQWRRIRLIDAWDDSALLAGQEWRDRLLERVRSSQLLVMLVTDCYIDSEWCIAELKIARSLHDQGEAVVAPVLAEDANWDLIEELAELQVIKPFDTWASRSRNGWQEAARLIGKAIDAFIAGSYLPTAAPNRPEIPPLLPYTVGRDQETAQFTNALLAAPPNRPFVCSLSGARQGQSEFIESLLVEGGSIRTSLELSGAVNRISIPGSQWADSSGPVERMLNSALAIQFQSSPATLDRAGIAASVASRPGLTVVTCEMTAEDWARCGNARLQQFLDYWAGWPWLAQDRRLIAFLVIRDDAMPFPIANGLSLRLASVTRDSLRVWLDTPKAKSRFTTTSIMADATAIFRRGPSVAMEDFAGAVVPILRRCQV